MTMATPTPKPHTSPSQIGMFARCPEQFNRRYIQGEKIPPGIAMIRGSGVHRAAQLNFMQKIESHADQPVQQIVDSAVAEFELLAADEVRLTAEESERGRKSAIGETVDSVVDLALLHAEEQAPDYQPVHVEKACRIELSGPKDLLGIIDLVDDKNRVTDFKTSGKSKSQVDADSSIQLTTYAAGVKAMTGDLPSEIRLDVGVALKTKTKRQVLSTERSEGDFKALGHRIDVMERAIASGNFTGADPSHWCCDARYCGYYNSCAFVNPKNRTFVELKTG